MDKFKLFLHTARPIDWFGLVTSTCVFVGGGYLCATHSLLYGLPLIIVAIAIPLIAYRKANP